MLETNGIISQTTVPRILKNWIILLWTADTQRSLPLCLLHNISAPHSLVQIMWGCHTTVCYNLCISKWLGLRLPQRVCLQAAQSPPGEVLIKSETKSFSCSSETRGLHRGRGGGLIVQHFHHNACHMENRRISYWLPARAKANTDPHMHRSGHLKPPHFTITTDETQESFCFL